MMHRMPWLKVDSLASSPGARRSFGNSEASAPSARSFADLDDVPWRSGLAFETVDRPVSVRLSLAKQVGHWLFTKGGMAPVLIGGLMLVALLGGAFGL